MKGNVSLHENHVRVTEPHFVKSMVKDTKVAVLSVAEVSDVECLEV